MPTHEEFFLMAAEEAKKALCLRANCGAVVVLEGKVIGIGHNGPPHDDIAQRKCEEDLLKSPKPRHDRTCCIHAEWRAIIEALKKQGNISGGTLYFMRADETGKPMKSGKPYCTICSRLALEAGLKYFGLWHEAGIKLYDTKEYNELSYAFHKQDAQ